MKQARTFYAKSISVLMATGILLQASPLTLGSAAEEAYYYGDLDGDGVLTAADLTLMKRILANQTVTSIQQELCDLDESGTFDSADIVMMQDYLLTKIDRFPAGVTYTHEEPVVYDGIKTLAGSRQMEYLDRGV